MCSEIHQFSSFLRRMSGSDKPQIFPVEKEDEREDVTKLENVSQPISENLDHSCPEIVSETGTAVENKGHLGEEINKEEETDQKATISRRESEKQISEDDDGFKTPTSSDHKIPAIIQCPPAPRKPRQPPSKLKRKASPPPRACRSLQLNASTAEVESIFRLINSNDQDDTQEQKIKKARTDDKDQS